VTNSIISRLFNVSGRNIVITGAAGMLGTQYANTLSEAGANVILLDVDEQKSAKLAQTLVKRYKTDVNSYVVDITQENQVAKIKDQVVSNYKRIDGLVNNAGYTNKTAILNSKKMYLPFEEFPSDIWDSSIAVNLTGAFYCCREFGKHMLKQNKGVIVNIASTYGIVGADQRIYGKNQINSPVSYAAAKGAIINMTRYLASYWHGKNIRVNTLSPGGVMDEKYQDKDFIKRYSERTMLGRMAKKEEYNGAILFLLSDASSYMTGANLIVDGGWTAW